MLGPVTSQMRPVRALVEPAAHGLPSPPSTQSFSMKAPALAAFSACSTTGMASAADLERLAVVDARGAT